MDFTKALIDAGLRANSEEDLLLDPVLFVYNVSSDPKDGFTELVDFDNRATLRYGLGVGELDLPVVNCRENNIDVLKVIADNHELFGVQPIVVLGYPDSNEDTVFNNVMWQFERLSYYSLTEGFKLEGRLSKKSLEDLSVYEREKSTYTKADGTVKEYDPDVEMSDDEEE